MLYRLAIPLKNGSQKMDPGTVFLLENHQSKLGHAQNPYIAVMS